MGSWQPASWPRVGTGIPGGDLLHVRGCVLLTSQTPLTAPCTIGGGVYQARCENGTAVSLHHAYCPYTFTGGGEGKSFLASFAERHCQQN